MDIRGSSGRPPAFNVASVLMPYGGLATILAVSAFGILQDGTGPEGYVAAGLTGLWLPVEVMLYSFLTGLALGIVALFRMEKVRVLTWAGVIVNGLAAGTMIVLLPWWR